MNVVNFELLLGAARTLKLVKTLMLFSDIFLLIELFFFFFFHLKIRKICDPSQARSVGSILAWYREVPGSNPGKGENFSL